MPIHPTAIVHDGARIAGDAEIGPFCVVDEHVSIGAGCRLMQGVYVTGHTELGESCVIHPYAIVGHEPQDLKFPGERSFARIGARTVLREFVQVHRGTAPESETVLGEDCYLMVAAHVGHNCRIGNHVIIANGTLLAGHVTVEDHANISGNAVVHQFCRIGERAMLQGHSGVGRDIVPFAIVDRMGLVVGINSVGLRRAEVPKEDILALREAFRLLYGKGTVFSAAVEQLADGATSPYVRKLVRFLQAESKRGFAGKSRTSHGD